jgi:hypothetical protein
VTVEMLSHPTFSVASPIVMSVLIANWASLRSNAKSLDLLGKRIDDLSKRIDDLRSDMNVHFAAVDTRLGRLEDKVSGLQERAWR